MLSRNANYDMDQAQSEIEDKLLLLDTKVETQVILQILVEKGIVTAEEIQEWRNKVKKSPKYKSSYDYLNTAKEKSEFYKNNPEQHLKDILDAKLSGKIK